MTTKLEPKGKLGIVSAAVGAVNGPEGELFDWDAVDWRACERQVERLRQRIFTASQVGDLTRVRNLQKLMLRSRANTLLAVRRVTEVNAGRLTAGVDGRIVLDGQDKAALAEAIQRRQQPWQARPVASTRRAAYSSVGAGLNGTSGYQRRRAGYSWRRAPPSMAHSAPVTWTAHGLRR